MNRGLWRVGDFAWQPDAGAGREQHTRSNLLLGVSWDGHVHGERRVGILPVVADLDLVLARAQLYSVAVCELGRTHRCADVQHCWLFINPNAAIAVAEGAEKVRPACWRDERPAPPGCV